MSQERSDLLGSLFEIADKLNLLNILLKLFNGQFLLNKFWLLVVIGVSIDIIGISIGNNIVDQLLNLLASSRFWVSKTVSVELVFITISEKLVSKVGVDLVSSNHIPIKDESTISNKESL